MDKLKIPVWMDYLLLIHENPRKSVYHILKENNITFSYFYQLIPLYRKYKFITIDEDDNIFVDLEIVRSIRVLKNRFKRDIIK